MPNPYISLLKTVWRNATGEKKRLVFVYFLFLVNSAIAAIYPLWFGWFINKLQKDGTERFQQTLIYGSVYILLKIAEWAFYGPALTLERKISFNISQRFLLNLYHKTLSLPLKWHRDNHSGATINRIKKAHDGLQTFLQNGFKYFYIIIKFFVSITAMLFFSPFFGGIGIVLGAITIWAIYKFDKPYIKVTDDINDKEHALASELFDSLSNIKTIKVLRLESPIKRNLTQKIYKTYRPLMRAIQIYKWKSFTTEILVAIIYLVTIMGYVIQTWRPGEPFMIGNLIALLGFVNQFTSIFHDIAWEYTDIMQQYANVKTADYISDAFEEQHIDESAPPIALEWKTISIKNLNFCRDTINETETRSGIFEINIDLEKSKRIAIIGESGSGKSTLLETLRGLNIAQAGTKIIIDGKHVINQMDISREITLFAQEPEVFETTIKNNITLGLPFNDHEIYKACEISQFLETLKRLPKGLNSTIQENGVNLSGGQKQRLALARGILFARTSNIILLDEPTSSVDLKTELLIYNSIFKEFKEKVIVSSIHRLHLLEHFDYIYIMKDGLVADEGSFEDLSIKSPHFNNLWKKYKLTSNDA